MRYKSFPASFKAASDAPDGTFEAIVAVFNNVDRGGDKIIPGAFKESLGAWKEKGRPIPVIYAHQWDNLDAHIGQVLEAKEVDEGLYVKAQLDMEEQFAQRVWKKMKAGTLAEFSFAYDVVDMAQVKTEGEWINELRKLELLEVGPCLVGMNPETQLLAVKGVDVEALKRAWETLNSGFRDMAGVKVLADEGATEGEAGDGKPSGHEPSICAARIAADLIEYE